MKKVLYFAMLLIAVMATSCSGSSYDQKKVDELKAKTEKGQVLSEDDVKVLIEQANFALDEAEKADDIIKWFNDNKDGKFVAIAMGMALDFAAEQQGYSEETVKAMKAVAERANAFFQKTIEAQVKAAGIDISEEPENDSAEAPVPVEEIATEVDTAVVGE